VYLDEGEGAPNCRARKCGARKCRREYVGAEMSCAEVSVNQKKLILLSSYKL
jgi:hypothetical protein